MQVDVIGYLNENYGKKVVVLGKRISLVNEVLDDLLAEVIQNTQRLQLNNKYEEAITSIKIQEEINKLLRLNSNVMGELVPEQKEEVEYGEYKADESVPYTLNDNFKFKRPYKFKLENHAAEITTWKEMLVKTCEYLNELNPTLFESFASDKSMQWGETHNFSKDKDLLRGPVKIEGSEVYVETNKDSIAVRQIIAKMLSKYDINKDDYQVFLRADYTDKRIERKN